MGISFFVTLQAKHSPKHLISFQVLPLSDLGCVSPSQEG